MYDEIEKSIKSLAKKSDSDTENDALKFSQAALNLAHTLATLVAARKELRS